MASFLFILGGFLNHLLNERQCICCAGDKHFSCGGQMHFALVANVLMLETNTSKSHVQTSSTPHTTSYQQLSPRTYLEINATHKYSPLKTGRTKQAGLNRLQVNQVDRENDKQTSPYTQLVPSKLITDCTAHAQQSKCGLAIHAKPTQLLCESQEAYARECKAT